MQWMVFGLYIYVFKGFVSLDRDVILLNVSSAHLFYLFIVLYIIVLILQRLLV